MVLPDDNAPRKIVLRFFRTTAGSEPVREWLLGLERDDRKAVGQDLMLVQFGWPIGMPLCRSLGEGLWEVRTNLSGGRISRVIFCFEDGELIALNSFIKKTQKTPSTELATARKRRQDYRK